jgi:hypothetical protein
VVGLGLLSLRRNTSSAVACKAMVVDTGGERERGDEKTGHGQDGVFSSLEGVCWKLACHRLLFSLARMVQAFPPGISDRTCVEDLRRKCWIVSG